MFITTTYSEGGKKVGEREKGRVKRGRRKRERGEVKKELGRREEGGIEKKSRK